MVYCLRVITCNVSVPPQVRVSPSTQFHTTGATVTLKCHADGIPEPDISWEKNEAPLPEDREPGHFIRLCKIYPHSLFKVLKTVYL